MYPADVVKRLRERIWCRVRWKVIISPGKKMHLLMQSSSLRIVRRRKKP